MQSKSGFQSWFYFTGTLLSSGAILYLGKSLFIPLGYAFFISIVLYPLCHKLEQKGVRRELAILTGLTGITLLIVLMFLLFGLQLQTIFLEWPLIYAKITELLLAVQHYLSDRFNLTDDQLTAWLTEMLSSTFNSSAGIVGTTLESFLLNLAMLALIPIYAYLILAYRSRLVRLLFLLMPEGQREKLSEVLQLSVHTYFRFIKGMAVVYFAVGTLNSVGLWLMGVPYAFLFGYLTAVMTFIPYIGIIVSSILPITYAWVTYGIIWYPLGVIALFAFVQYLEANVIFPWAVGQRLELNTLSTLLVIIIGGIVWGASGMILFIPFAAIAKLVADRMPGWEALSVFLGNSEEAKK